MAENAIYLDNHATTRVDPRVLESMLPFFTEHYANAASKQHRPGQFAHEAVENARRRIAALIGADPREIVFTSGATESNNLALKGVARRDSPNARHFVTSCIEHHAVLDVCRRLESEGVAVTYLPVDRFGRVDPDAVRASLTDQTLLVSVMLANNEIGTLQPIGAIGRTCKERGVLFHCDAAQAVGKTAIDVESLGIDLLSISAHKMHGPKGVGALYVRRRHPHVQLVPLFDGGGHERGLRSGTVPVPLAVGLGAACALYMEEGPEESMRVAALRDRLQESLLAAIPDIKVNGPPSNRLPGNLNISIADISAQVLMTALPELAISSGSACTSASIEPSYVLKAIGLTDDLAHGSLRFGLSRFTTQEDVDRAAAMVAGATAHLRALIPSAGRM